MDITSQSPYLHFDREKWAALRNSEPMTLTFSEVKSLKGIDDELSMEEVRDIYLPLSRLLSYYVNARLNRQAVLMKFLNHPAERIPFIIGVSGSVSVGKSTTSRVLQALLRHWSPSMKVDLITTDGFLHPNAVLEERGLIQKKGFPESYDTRRLLQFVMDLKSGKRHIQAPKYSHLIYDIVPNDFHHIDQPDILILEGLNVLQSGCDYPYKERSSVFVSNFVDFSIFVDADEKLLEEWYISRFLKLRKSAFSDPQSYFVAYSKLSEREAVQVATDIWRRVNLENLRRNIQPTRERASLILHKTHGHVIDSIRLRK